MNLTLLTVCSLLSAILVGEGTNTGVFVRSYWFESGIEYGNPTYNSRFRVNAPETSLSQFKDRAEARDNGMMLIQMEEDLALLDGAELALEIWGGHPGTVNKRVAVNGRSTYEIPEVGTADENCTYSYPVFPLKITDLVNGYNAFQFACDQGKTFWGHYIVDNASLRARLKGYHPLLKELNLDSFRLIVVAESVNQDRMRINLNYSPENALQEIESVDYYGFYTGYDENGNTEKTDWHGMTKDRKPYGHLGTSTKGAFEMDWDTSMLPAQKKVRIRAVAHFKKDPSLTYVTESFPSELSIPERKNTQVKLIESGDTPHPFWSRANRKSACTLPLDINPARIERAELYVLVWDGGAGAVKDYFTLNGHPLAVAGTGKHDLIYSQLPIDPAILKQGDNRIELLSDTEHHGIEVLLPGPALMIRYK